MILGHLGKPVRWEDAGAKIGGWRDQEQHRISYLLSIPGAPRTPWTPGRGWSRRAKGAGGAAWRGGSARPSWGEGDWTLVTLSILLHSFPSCSQDTPWLFAFYPWLFYLQSQEAATTLTISNFLTQRYRAISCTVSDFIPITTTGNRHFYPHFTDKKTKIWNRIECVAQRHAPSRQEPRFELMFP